MKKENPEDPMPGVHAVRAGVKVTARTEVSGTENIRVKSGV